MLGATTLEVSELIFEYSFICPISPPAAVGSKFRTHLRQLMKLSQCQTFFLLLFFFKIFGTLKQLKYLSFLGQKTSVQRPAFCKEETVNG